MYYTIGEFAELTGLSITTLRYYEQEHLICPERKANGQRIYSEGDATWIAFIVRLKETGMPIREIRRYAALRAQGVSTLEERRDMLLAHRRTLEKRIQTMQSHLTMLNDKISYYEDAIEGHALSQ